MGLKWLHENQFGKHMWNLLKRRSFTQGVTKMKKIFTSYIIKLNYYKVYK
jgi:hypothetical protein